jgi:hypothetical protein
MKTTDQLIGEIVRNPDDAEGTFRGWLGERLADPDVPLGDPELPDDLARILDAWNVAIEITDDEYATATAEAGACTDPAHATRFPDPAAYGDDQPAHVAVHLGL